MSTIKEAIAKAPSGRVRRNPLERRSRLSARGKEDGYEYRFINDDGDRIAQKMEEGWEHVPKSAVKVGDKRVDNVSPEGSVSQVYVGSGENPKKGFLMRIRKDWYEEDQKAKQDYVDATEQATKQQALDGHYGKIEFQKPKS